MKKLLFVSLCIFALDMIASAQCPTVTITAPAGKIPAGRKATFSATVTDAGSVKPTYLWKTRIGSIVSGQGTAEIVIDTTGGKPRDYVIATVIISPFPITCTSVVASRGVTLDWYADAWKQYSWTVGSAEEKGRLETINKRLTYFGGKETLFIFAYPGPGQKRSDAEAEIKRITGILGAMSPDRKSVV